MEGRKNLGRRKVKIEKMLNLNHLHVTFSKRRAGLFKKAHELSVMCSVEVGLVCFSPAGKAFSYGNPNIVHVLNHFENDGGSAIPNDELIIELNNHLAQIESQIDVDRKIGKDHDKRIESEASCWWRGENYNQASLEAVQQLIVAMENLKRHAVEEAAKLQVVEPAPTINVVANLPFDLYGNYGGAYPFAIGTSAAASSSKNYLGAN